MNSLLKLGILRKIVCLNFMHSYFANLCIYSVPVTATLIAYAAQYPNETYRSGFKSDFVNFASSLIGG